MPATAVFSVRSKTSPKRFLGKGPLRSTKNATGALPASVARRYGFDAGTGDWRPLDNKAKDCRVTTIPARVGRLGVTTANGTRQMLVAELEGWHQFAATE